MLKQKVKPEDLLKDLVNVNTLKNNVGLLFLLKLNDILTLIYKKYCSIFCIFSLFHCQQVVGCFH